MAEKRVIENQVFVRNLSYEVTSEDLVSAFEEYGPLKGASVATEKDGSSRGFGFVKFALKEDAEAAVTALQGGDLKGRAMKLEMAQSGHAKEEKPQKQQIPTEEISETAAANAANMTSADIRPALQVALLGVPHGYNKKIITREIIKKIHRKSTIASIDESHALFESLGSEVIVAPAGRSMLITCPSRKHTELFVSKLNSVNLASLVSAAVQQESGGSSATLFARRLADVTDVRLRKKKCRLILRNLSFQASVANVIDRMVKFGPLVEASLPTVTVQHKDGNTKQKSRGFAFVTYLCATDADKAVKESSGLKICNREFAVDYCDSKHGHEKQLQAQKEAATNEGEATEVQPEDDKEEVSEDEADEGDEMSEEDQDDSDQSDKDDEEAEQDAEEDDGEEDALSESDENAAAATPAGDVSEQRTVFVRDLAFDATSADLRKTFARFGTVDMVAIVKDKTTGMSKGSAFVRFSTRDAAMACVEFGENARSINKITVSGRPCRVSIAVSRDEAKRIEEEEKKGGAGAGRDRRNLYLATEGLLIDNRMEAKRQQVSKKGNKASPEEISELDREKRRKAQAEKKKKLLNPLYFVSPTRLSIRNLNKSVTDNELRNLCRRATAAGIASGLVSESDMLAHLMAQGVGARDRTPERLSIPPAIEGPKGMRIMRKVKVMLDNMRMRNGVPQSRGYGFAEFLHHGHALACLRELNNNPRYSEFAASSGGYKSSRRLIVEFTVENYQKVQLLNMREESRQLQKQEHIEDQPVEEMPSRKRTREEQSDDEDEHHSEEEVEQHPDVDTSDMDKKQLKKLKRREAQKKRKAMELKRKEAKRQKREELAQNQQGEEPPSSNSNSKNSNSKSSGEQKKRFVRDKKNNSKNSGGKDKKHAARNKNNRRSGISASTKSNDA